MFRPEFMWKSVRPVNLAGCREVPHEFRAEHEGEAIFAVRVSSVRCGVESGGQGGLAGA